MIKRIGEFDLIRRLTKNLPLYSGEVVKGVGDDSAVFRQNKDLFLLATCDVQVARVHFLTTTAKPEQIGHKAVAVNVSDIAAMGGKSTSCLVSLLLPRDTETKFIDGIYDGIKKICKTEGVQIIGGNISEGKELAIDIFMLGEVKPDELLLRSGAKPGDKLMVTGTLGGAAAGLELLINKNITIPETEKSKLIIKQLTPVPRSKEALAIAELKLATSMIDISDGLAGDIGHICEQSKVGIEIFKDKLPVKSSTVDVAKQLNRDPIEFALTGGEDYELLFTVPEKAVDKIIKTVKDKTGTQVSVIGEVLPEKEGKWLRLKNGKRIPLISKGWDHFK